MNDKINKATVVFESLNNKQLSHICEFLDKQVKDGYELNIRMDHIEGQLIITTTNATDVACLCTIYAQYKQ